MLKLAGCICILLASTGMAYSYVCGLHRELRRMEQLLDLLAAIEGEITYSRCPLPELLLQLSGHMPQPYQGLLETGSQRMEANQEADIPSLWEHVCSGYRSRLDIPKEAYQVLVRLGEVFAYASLESSMQLLRFGRKKLEGLIADRHKEAAGKQKLYCCICYMAGLFSIILLL